MIRKPEESIYSMAFRNEDWGRPILASGLVKAYSHWHDHTTLITVNDKPVLVAELDDYSTKIVFDTCCVLFNPLNPRKQE